MCRWMAKAVFFTHDFYGVSQANMLARVENFGTVLFVILFDTEGEAVRMINDPIYCLAVSVWTDKYTALKTTQ